MALTSRNTYMYMWPTYIILTKLASIGDREATNGMESFGHFSHALVL